MAVEKIERKIIFEKEIIEELRKYSIDKTGNEKRLSETLNNILREYFKKGKGETLTSNQTAHTHTNGIMDIITWVNENNPKGITREQITRVIQDMKGFDIRTIKKYEPIVLDRLKEQGYQEHPRNPKVLIRYDID